MVVPTQSVGAGAGAAERRLGRSQAGWIRYLWRLVPCALVAWAVGSLKDVEDGIATR